MVLESTLIIRSQLIQILMVFCMIQVQELLDSSARSSEQSKRKVVNPKFIKV